MSAPEFHLQKSICQILEAAYPQVWFTAIPNGAALCATNDPVGRRRAKREVAKLKVTGMKPGTPDMVLAWGRDDWFANVGWLEVKAPKGVLSEDQKTVHAILTSKGHRVAVVRSVDELHKVLAEWGCPSRIAA